MGGAWRTWCDQCEQTPFNGDLSSCGVCDNDVCKACSHKGDGERVCDACSYKETDCYECGGDDDCDRCDAYSCSVLLCRGCTQWTLGKNPTRLCHKHAYECYGCDETFTREALRTCARKDCGKFLCGDCGKTTSGALLCDAHTAGTCQSCNERFATPDDRYGCTACARCEGCNDDEEKEFVVCLMCGYSPTCAICLSNNDSHEGELCGRCVSLTKTGCFWDLTDREVVLRFNAYAYKHNFPRSVHPDDAEEMTGGECIFPPLPTVAEPDQRVLTGTPDKLTAWGDLALAE